MFGEMTRKYLPGETVPAGLYLNRKSWEFVHVGDEGGELPAGANVAYHRLPILMVMGLAPVVGLAFILFLPVAVPIVLLYSGIRAIARRIGRRMAGPAEGQVRLAH